MDYLTYRVGEVAERLQDKNNPPLQRAFGKHLDKVAEALHDIEWVWSGDYGRGDEEEAIKAVLADATTERVINVLISDAHELITELNKYINNEKTDDDI